VGMLVLTHLCWGQNRINWQRLSHVSFEYDYIGHLQTLYAKPDFGKQVKELEGEKIEIKGYVIPIDIEKKAYVLSAYPNRSCFFCGNAGPETVMELRFKSKHVSYKIDEVHIFRGKLQFGKTVEELTYILEEAEEIR